MGRNDGKLSGLRSMREDHDVPGLRLISLVLHAHTSHIRPNSQHLIMFSTEYQEKIMARDSYYRLYVLITVLLL